MAGVYRVWAGGVCLGVAGFFTVIFSSTAIAQVDSPDDSVTSDEVIAVELPQTEPQEELNPDVSGAPLIVPTSGVARADDPHVVALRSARAAVEAEIAKGELVRAGTLLAESLRALPSDRGDLADAAYESVQLGMFLMEYLMPDADFDTFVKERLDTEKYPTDKFLTSLHDIFIGQMDNGAKTNATREIGYLTGSEHRAVRAMALFNASNPYFHRDTLFTSQHIEILVAEYPELDLAQIAQNLVLYDEKDQFGLEGMERATEIRSTKQAAEPWAVSLRQRIQQSAQTLKSKSADGAALAPLLDGALNASDWKERHFCLIMVKSEYDGPQRDALLETARELALRQGDTPDILQARTLMARVTSAEASEKTGDKAALEESLYWANLLLDTPVGRATPERDAWEDRMKGIRRAANNLREGGYLDESEALFKALAAQYPNSLVAAECEQALAEIAAARR
jgi:hypothetical protein